MYEIHTNHGCISIKDEEDAINSFWMFGKYHDLDIKDSDIKSALDKKGYYEIGILSIIKDG